MKIVNLNINTMIKYKLVCLKGGNLL